MRILRRLEQKLAPYALPHVTIAIIAVQVLVYVVIYIQPNPQKEVAALERLVLVPDRVLQGEWWRLLTFVAIPSVDGKALLGPIFALIAWWALYFMGTTLEHLWGTFRYNFFLLVGYIATVAAAFAFPASYATSFYYLESILLAFAFLFPEFRFLLYFVLPVKARWLALLLWLHYAFILIVGPWMMRMMVFAAISNFVLFFWRDIFKRIGRGPRHMSLRAKHYVAAKKQQSPYRHRCTVCGVTDKTNPEEDFRYCSKCAGQYAYCSKHIRDHEHIAEAVIEG